MKRAQATAALETAANERFSMIFGVLCMGLSGDANPAQAIKRFEAGFAMLLKAHTLAQNIIESSIPADKSDPGP
jgi:hypothetical protein